MRTTVVRYRTRPEQAEENQRLVEAVFAELAERAPAAFSYTSYRLDDGVSFVHVATEHDDAGTGTLSRLPSFQAFVAGIADRCEVPPAANGATAVGSYGRPAHGC